MTRTRNQNKTISTYLLIIGGILIILPNIPIINETLSIYRYQFLNFSGGANFLGRYGTFQNFFSIKGWTPFGLQGEVIWLVFVIVGLVSLLSAVILKSQPAMLVSGLLGGIIGISLSALVFLGKHNDFNHFGLSNLGNYEYIGSGFWCILVGCILILFAGLIVFRK